jgi:hypothetical protein
VQVVGRLAEADPAAPPPVDPIEDLVDARSRSDSPQLTGEKLLQRLSAPLGPALEPGVDVFRDVSNEKVRHACNMIALAPASIPSSALTDAVRMIAAVGPEEAL